MKTETLETPHMFWNGPVSIDFQDTCTFIFYLLRTKTSLTLDSNFWTRSVHIEDPQNRTWSCDIFPYRKPMELIPSIGEIHNLAVCPTNFGGAENTVVVTKENPLNDIEAITELEGRFKQGIGGFICRCEDANREPCKFE